MNQPNNGHLPLAQSSATGPPLIELLRFLGRALAVSYGLLSRTTFAFALSLLAPFSLLYSPVGYLLAPVFVLAQLLFNALVLTPYAVTVAVAHNLYPIYVFVAIACICAVCVGAAARVLSRGLMALLLGPHLPRKQQEQKQGVWVEGKEKSAMKTGTSKTRVRKRVSIKQEYR